MMAMVNHEALVVFLIAFACPIALKVLIELITGTAVTVRRFSVYFFRRDEDSSNYWWVVLSQVGVVCFLVWLCFFKKP
jgi:hypothetical protein